MVVKEHPDDIETRSPLDDLVEEDRWFEERCARPDDTTAKKQPRRA